MGTAFLTFLHREVIITSIFCIPVLKLSEFDKYPFLSFVGNGIDTSSSISWHVLLML